MLIYVDFMVAWGETVNVKGLTVYAATSFVLMVGRQRDCVKFDRFPIRRFGVGRTMT